MSKDDNKTGRTKTLPLAEVVRMIEEAIEEADKPDARFLDHDDVEKWLSKWGKTEEELEVLRNIHKPPIPEVLFSWPMLLLWSKSGPKVGFISRQDYIDRTLAIVRGEYKPDPDEPKIWLEIPKIEPKVD